MTSPSGACRQITEYFSHVIHHQPSSHRLSCCCCCYYCPGRYCCVYDVIDMARNMTSCKSDLRIVGSKNETPELKRVLYSGVFVTLY